MNETYIGRVSRDDLGPCQPIGSLSRVDRVVLVVRVDKVDRSIVVRAVRIVPRKALDEDVGCTLKTRRIVKT